ncbi:hypothetical protein C1646_706318, partial [Rhizophagus diaphanus]
FLIFKFLVHVFPLFLIYSPFVFLVPLQISSNISFSFLSLVHISFLTYYLNGYKTW